jgi:MFS superfamily sulfate permease-like transporter
MEGGRMENKNKVLGIIPLIIVYGTTKFCSRCWLPLFSCFLLLALLTFHAAAFSIQHASVTSNYVLRID